MSECAIIEYVETGGYEIVDPGEVSYSSNALGTRVFYRGKWVTHPSTLSQIRNELMKLRALQAEARLVGAQWPELTDPTFSLENRLEDMARVLSQGRVEKGGPTL